MTKESIILAENQADFIRASIASGRYGNVNEVVRAGLCLLEEKLAEDRRNEARLRDMLDAAADSGLSPNTPEAIWQQVEDRYRAADA